MNLLDLIDSDPEALAMATAGNDAGCASRLCEIAPKRRVSTMLTERGLYEAIGPQAAESVLQKLEAVSQQNAIVRRALSWLSPANGGLDFGSATTLGMLAQLLGHDEYAAIDALSLVNADISANEVSEAMKERRNA
jgi:hypothetical protein